MFIYIVFAVSVGVAAVFLVAWLAGVRYIPHSRVGIVEKLWSGRGSLTQGRIVALNARQDFKPACSGAVSIWASSLGNTASTKSRW